MNLMRKIRTLTLLSIVGLGLLIPIRAARANFVTQTVSTSPGGTATDFALPLSVASFDGRLGTLQSVTMTVSESETMHGFVQNRSPISENYVVTEASNFTFSMGNQMLMANQLWAQQAYVGLEGNQSLPFGTFHSWGTTGPVTLSTGAVFNAFITTEPQVSFELSSLTSTAVMGGGGNANTGIYTEAVATLTITYDYTPLTSVPEPASLVLTGLGGLSVLLASRRWRRQRSNSRRDRPTPGVRGRPSRFKPRRFSR